MNVNVTIERPVTDYMRIGVAIITDPMVGPMELYVYCKILCMDNGDSLNIRMLSSSLGLSERKTREALVSLERLGYIERVPVRTDKGKFTGWMYNIFAAPIEAEKRTFAGCTEFAVYGQSAKRTSRLTDLSETAKSVTMREGQKSCVADNRNIPQETYNQRDIEKRSSQLTECPKTANSVSRARVNNVNVNNISLTDIDKINSQYNINIQERDMDTRVVSGKQITNDMIAAVLSSQGIWMETVAKKWHIGTDELKERFVQFAQSNVVRGIDSHDGLRDLKSHFDSWMMSVTRAEGRQEKTTSPYQDRMSEMMSDKRELEERVRARRKAYNQQKV